MLLFNILKFGVPLVLALFGLLQTIIYLRLSKVYDALPVVAAEIIESKLRDFHDINERRIFEARIRYTYTFRGEEYIGDTPVLEGPNLFKRFSRTTDLLKRYSVGDIVNARVIPTMPHLAYLEMQPLNKISAILLPAICVGLLLYFGAIGWFFSFVMSL